MKAKEPMVATIKAKKVKPKKKRNVTDQRVLNKPRNQSAIRFEAKGKSLPKSKRGLRTNHFYHHCGLQGHTRPNFHKLRALKNASDQRQEDQEMTKRIRLLSYQDADSGVMDMMKMIVAFTTCLESFNKRFENHNTHTQSYRDITPNARDVWVKKGTHA